MPLSIIDRSDDQLLTVDPTSNALRATPCDTAGTANDPVVTGSYIAPVNIRMTTATAANSFVWSLRAGSRGCYVRRIYLTAGFDGTALAASGTLRMGITRFRDTSPTTGTVVPIIKKRTNCPPSTVMDCRFLQTGLVITGVTVDTDEIIIGLPVISVQVGAPTNSGDVGPVLQHDMAFERGGQTFDCFELLPYEGMAIRTITVASIIGFSLNGFVAWDEI